MQSADTIVIGAGIAGASVAWQLVQDKAGGEGASVLLLERESQPGYHTTGRSAALYMATYGTPNIQALTRASRAFYDAPPPEFGSDPILSPRGVVYVAGPDQLDMLKQAYAEAHAISPNVEWVEQAALLAQLPCLKPEAVAAGMSEPEAADIDVHALHQGYLRGLRQHGGQVLTHAEVTAVRREGDIWQVTLADGRVFAAPTIVNAAGAWADVVAGLAGVPPIGLEPRRRTAFTFPVPEGMTMMYHSQEKIINTPGSEITGTRGGIHNSVTRIVLKPTHMIGGYAQLSYGFNYYGTIGTNRDEFVVVRKMNKVDWLEEPAGAPASGAGH